jgi:hypothetical protein
MNTLPTNNSSLQNIYLLHQAFSCLQNPMIIELTMTTIPSIPSLLDWALRKVLLLLPVFLFLFAIKYAQSQYYRDMTSQFFDPSRAYEQRYSVVRRHEADTFVNVAVAKSYLRSPRSPPLLCLGMLTVARPSGDVYFCTSVGSLLAGLTPYREMRYTSSHLSVTRMRMHILHSRSYG